MKQKEEKNLILYTGNALIDTIHHQKFTEIELKVMYWLFSQINKEDIELYNKNIIKTIVIPASELATELQFENNKSFHYLKQLAETIQSKTMTSKLDSGFTRVAIIPTFQYTNGMITLGLHPYVLPHLIDLQSKYTKFYLRNVLNLESSYAIKLYTLLKQYQSAGTREFTVEELRIYFGIQKHEYIQYGSFKLRVIKMAVSHINKSTDIFIEYIEIKKSYKVVAIKFIIVDNHDKIIPTITSHFSTSEINQIIQFFINLATFDINLTKKITQYLKEKNNTYVIKAMLYTYTKKPKNPQAYFFTALTKGYGQNIAIGELEHLTYKKLDKFRIY